MPQLNFKEGVIVFKKTLILSLLFFMIVSANSFITTYAISGPITVPKVVFYNTNSTRRGNQIIVKGYFENLSNSREARVNYIEFTGNFNMLPQRFNVNIILPPYAISQQTFTLSVYGKGKVGAITSRTNFTMY